MGWVFGVGGADWQWTGPVYLGVGAGIWVVGEPTPFAELRLGLWSEWIGRLLEVGVGVVEGEPMVRARLAVSL